MTFRFGDDLLLSFDPKEFSVVMGLQYIGRYVEDKATEPLVGLNRLFKDVKKRS